MSTPGAGRPGEDEEPRTARDGRTDRRTLIADTAIDLVATAGLRGLTHRAVDGAAQLPAGSTSYYFRTRTALIGACYQRLAELDLADYEGDDRPAAGDRDAVAAALAALLHRWLTSGRARQLARFELSMEAARNPDLEPEFHRAGQAARVRAAGILAALGAQRPREAAELLVAWTDGLLYDRLVGALARSRPAPDRAELAAAARRMLDAALAPQPELAGAGADTAAGSAAQAQAQAPAGSEDPGAVSMAAELQCVVLDCPDPLLLAGFYRSVAGGTVNLPDPRWSLGEGWATLHTPSGLVLAFQRVADHRPPHWPDPDHPQQFHLDFGVPDLDRAHELALAGGATLLDGRPDTGGWRIYADPAGHPFCLVRH